MHGETYKARWFVLARVPHGTVLIYYDRKCMDEAHIVGFIDMRRVIAVREGSRTITFDASRSKSAAAMNKMFSLMGMGSSRTPTSIEPKPVLELVTSTRTYTLCPCSSECPSPISMAASVGVSFYGKPLYLFGWPFPIPHLNGAVIPTEDDVDESSPELREAIEESDKEASATARAMLDGDESNGSIFSTWQARIREVVQQEKVSRVFPVVLVVDSTGTLAQKLLLRVTPAEIAFVDVDDKDRCYAAIPHNDLIKWGVQAETEIKIQARTRSRLVARSDYRGFQAQRPTRTSQHFVFKSTAAKMISQCIDGHVRSLAAELGDLPPGGMDSSTSAEDDESSAYSASKMDAEIPEESKKKLTHKAVSQKFAPSKASRDDDDDDEEDEDDAPKGGKKSPASGKGSVSSSTKTVKKKMDDSDDEDEAPKKPATSTSGSSKAGSKSPLPTAAGKKKVVDDDDDSEDEKPTKSSTKSASTSSTSTQVKKKVIDDDDSEEEEKPKAKGTASKSPTPIVTKKKVDDDDDSDEDNVPKKSPTSSKSTTAPVKKPVVDDDDDEDDKEEERKKAAALKKRKDEEIASAAAAAKAKAEAEEQARVEAEAAAEAAAAAAAANVTEGGGEGEELPKKKKKGSKKKKETTEEAPTDE